MSTATTELATIDPTRPLPVPQLREFLSARLDTLRAAFPATLRAEEREAAAARLVVALVSACRADPKLAACTGESLYLALLKVAAHRLEIGPPLNHCYLIPRKGAATFQLGYPGVVELVGRSGQVLRAAAGVVREGDEFAVWEGTAPRIEHKHGKARGAITHFYGVVVLSRGDPIIRVMTTEEVDDHRKKYSEFGTDAKGNRAGTWAKSFEEMGRKTLVIKVCKAAPKSVEFRALDLALADSAAPDAPPAADAPEALPEHAGEVVTESGEVVTAAAPPADHPAVADARALKDLAALVGQTPADCYDWLHAQYGVRYPAGTKLNDIPIEQRRALVAALSRTEPDADEERF